MAPTRDGLKAMKRSQLQKLCKWSKLQQQNRLRGNLKTAELVDLLAAHFEKQNRMSELTTGSTVPSPIQSTAAQDENQEPQARISSIPAVGPTPEKFSPVVVDLTDIDLNQLSQPNLPTSSRVVTLEALCTRLLSQNTSATATIAALQARLDAAEQSITTLTSALDDTRTQLGNAQTQISNLVSTVSDSEKTFSESNQSLSTELARLQEMAQSVGSRLAQAEERWQANFKEVIKCAVGNDDKLPFEFPTSVSGPSQLRRSKSKEPLSSTIVWAKHQQAITGALAPPAVRLFGASPDIDHAALDDERPGSGSAPQNCLAPSALPFNEPRVAGSRTASTHSLSQRKSSDSHQAESSRAGAQAVHSRESSKTVGKRPVSPSPISFDRSDSDIARATKRARHGASSSHGEASSSIHHEKSPSLNSLSAGASASTVDSPLFPPSPAVPPATPPSKRPTTLLPPVEIISTPSPSGRSHTSVPMHKDYADSHGFATTPRPPVEGPGSPTLESPRRRRFKDDVPPPMLTFTPTELIAANSEASKKKDKQKERPLPRSAVEPAKAGQSPPLIIGKGKVFRPSVDPETASAVRSSRTNSVDADGDTGMTAHAEVPDVSLGGPPPQDVSRDPTGREQLSIVSPMMEAPSRSKPGQRGLSFFAPRPEFPAMGTYSSLALPPPPPHNTLSASRRLGSASLLTAASVPLVTGLRDYAADPDELDGSHYFVPTRSITRLLPLVTPPLSSSPAPRAVPSHLLSILDTFDSKFSNVFITFFVLPLLPLRDPPAPTSELEMKCILTKYEEFEHVINTSVC
ncbi:hypothetical protein FRB99_008639 [Tulasnella sp. 403]|nr:hypothetical protein FRB99_008639 [Tulasnella sp. 403]